MSTTVVIGNRTDAVECVSVAPPLRKPVLAPVEVARRPLTTSSKPPSFLFRGWYHVYSIWLFTFSDLKTIVFPSTLFGLTHALTLLSQNGSLLLDSADIFHAPVLGPRFLLVPFWVWLNLLPFNVNNQRQSSAVQEDEINKPWRPLPSRRMGPAAATQLMLIFYLLAILSSFYLGNALQCLILIAIGTWYNNFGGADVSWQVRNGINGVGFVCFISGAMQVAIGTQATSAEALSAFGWWSVVIAAIVFTTVQTQDMYDQRGDAARGRRTMPLVIGDANARKMIAVAMAVWCWLPSWLWGVCWTGYMGPLVLGLFVILRTLSKTTEAADKVTFRIWNLWLVTVYTLPLVAALQAK